MLPKQSAAQTASAPALTAFLALARLRMVILPAVSTTAVRAPTRVVENAVEGSVSSPIRPGGYGKRPSVKSSSATETDNESKTFLDRSLCQLDSFAPWVRRPPIRILLTLMSGFALAGVPSYPTLIR